MADSATPEPETVEADSSDACAKCGSVFYIMPEGHTEFDVCRDCGHLFGEKVPAKEQPWRIERSKLVKTLEAAMRSADDLQDLRRFAGHDDMIECFKAAIDAAKAIK